MAKRLRRGSQPSLLEGSEPQRNRNPPKRRAAAQKESRSFTAGRTSKRLTGWSRVGTQCRNDSQTLLRAGKLESVLKCNHRLASDSVPSAA